jgi:flagellar basal body P-ring formation protein FlgA
VKNTLLCILMVAMIGLCPLTVGAAPAVQVVKEKKIREAVTQFIMGKTGTSGLEITIKRIGVSGDLLVPPGTVTYEFIAPRQWEGWGKSVLGLLVRVNDQLVKNLSIPVEVEALVPMVVTLRPLASGEVVGLADISVQKRDIAGLVGRICYDPAEAIGKRVRVAMRGNMPLRADFLEKVPVVRYGQLVTIVAENGALRVTTAGMVKGSAGEGDLVTVQNLNSKKDLQGRVVDAGTVAVNF